MKKWCTDLVEGLVAEEAQDSVLDEGWDLALEEALLPGLTWAWVEAGYRGAATSSVALGHPQLGHINSLTTPSTQEYHPLLGTRPSPRK